MDHFIEKDVEELLIVAGPVGSGRIKAALGGSIGQVQSCRSIYEALAYLLIAQHRTTAVAIVVDCLETEELEIFSCLARLAHVRTIAVSALAQSKKLTRARSLGANKVVGLGAKDEAVSVTVSVTVSPRKPAVKEAAVEPELTREELEKLLG